MPDPIMEEVNFTYDQNNQRYFLKIPKRKENVVIERVNPNSSMFKIRYESGKSIPELDSYYTGKTEAFNAFRSWYKRTKATKEVLHDKWFGEENPPELQRKTRPGRRKKVVDEPITSTESG